jgi:two-component system, sensor histidine kinase PdtaS
MEEKFIATYSKNLNNPLMVKIKWIVCLLLINVIAISKNSNTEILQIAKEYTDSANWYQNMPQYNYEKSMAFFDKAISIFEQNETLFCEKIATIYLQKIDILKINERFKTLDSIAKQGWQYIEMTKKYKANLQLEYEYLTAWAYTLLENGEHKKALQCFSKAIAISSLFQTEEQKALTNADKGIFYGIYSLNKDQKLAFGYLQEGSGYFENNGATKNAVILFKIYKAYIQHYAYSSKDSINVYLQKIKNVLPYFQQPQCHAWYYIANGRHLNTYSTTTDTIISAKQFRLAKENILKGLEIYAHHNITKNVNIPFAYGILGDININEKKYDDAITYYKKSQKNYEMLQCRKRALDMTAFIAAAYEKKENYKTALDYYKKFEIEYFDFEKESNDRSLRENELEIQSLQQTEKLNLESKKQVYFILATIVFITLLSLLFWNYKSKQKSNKLLALLNTDLETNNMLLDKRNADNELLLKEIHHRVKNNLEIVSSLLALQSAQIKDPNTKDAMTESQNRVHSIGIVHQKLYQGNNLGVIEMTDYFKNLGESIIDSFGAVEQIQLQILMEKTEVDIDTAVPMGLIVNELITNSIKYAFQNQEKGIITISLKKQNKNMCLQVADNGIGKSGITKGTGFGTQLVGLLTQQLNATLQEENSNGTKYIIEFVSKK